MFIREKKSKANNSSAIQIVENHRVGSTTKQQIIRHVGTGRTKESIEDLKRLAEVIKARLEYKSRSIRDGKVDAKFASILNGVENTNKKMMINVANLVEEKRYIIGIHDIYGAIYDQLGFKNLFTRPNQREEAAKILKDIVLARIAKPLSKRGSVKLLEDQFNVTRDLDQVYHMMDKMDEDFFERIQQCALTIALKLSGNKLRVLFYDVTTLYFESFIEDELKQNGYSKDMKFNQAQILLALLVTEKGLPIGYEVFPGSTFEGHTLVAILEKLKARHNLEDVIFVADRGLLSKANIELLEEKQFKYIVGARIKNVSKGLEKEILNEVNYKEIKINFNPNKKLKQDSQQKLATFKTVNGCQLIVHYSSERACKDLYDRNKAIEKLYKKLNKSKDPKSLVNNYGYKKYIEIKGEAKLSINEKRLEEAAKWDGLLGITTNIENETPEELLSHYRGLWQIEESFRINKHDLRMRPIFHWKPHRVKSHIGISFIAFVCVRYLEYILSIRSKKASPEVIRDALLTAQVSVIKDTSSNKKFLLTAKLPATTKEIYNVMKIKIPPHTQMLCGA